MKSFKDYFKDVPENIGFKPDELEAGIKVEMEHTDNPEVAELIAKQHLAEDPEYYTKLKTIHSD